MKYKCIIFDCDGILVDSEKISNKVLIDIAKSEGVQIDFDFAMEHFSGKSLKSVFDFIEKKLSNKLPESFEITFRQKTFELFKSELKPIEGIHTLLEKIQIPYCVASSGPLNKIILNLTTTNLINNFKNNIFSSYEIGSWKPDPEIFEYAAKKMGFKPNECAVIEDSIAGIRAAKAGGFDVFGYANKNNKNLFIKEGAKVFFEMENLVELL